MTVFRKRYLIPIFVLLLLLLRFVGEIGIDRQPSDRFRVAKVIDGDTVELAGGERLRLLGIDAPESDHPFHDAAKIFLDSLASNRAFEIKFSKKRRDGYGRLLGYIYIDSVFINAEVVRNGLAYVYLMKDNLTDNGMIETLINAQNEAIDRKLGLHAIKHHAEPYYPARNNSLRFHRPSCTSVRNLLPGEYRKFNSRSEALRAGYSPCRNCRP